MLGTIVDCIAIIVGCLIGFLLKGGIPERISTTVMKALALSVLFIGISGALKGTNTLVIIISMAVGSLLGELIDIEKRLNNFGHFIESKIKTKNNKISISQGFVTSSLLFCIGAMSVVGALESGLHGNYSTLFAKSVLDGVSAIIFTATLGIGVMLSSLSVLLYQGALTLGAGFLAGVLSDPVVANMTCIGSLLIIGLSLNMLDATKLKVANLLPAVFFPILFGIFGII